MTTSRREPTQVAIPADPDRLDVLRLVVRNACARRGASVDEIDDAALAVHEAGLALIDAGASRLELELGGDEGELTVTIGSPAAIPLQWEEGMSFRIIESVAAGVQVSNGNRGTSITLRLRVGGEPDRSATE